MAKDKVTPKRLDKDTDRRLRALDRAAHADETKAARKARRTQQGSVRRGVVFVVALLGLAGWGWSHGSRTPDGHWLLAVLIVAAALALIVVAGRRYVQHDRADAAYTKDIQKRVRQDRSGAHYQDGA